MRGVYGCPCLDNGKDLFWAEIGEGEVVCRRKRQDIAFACHRLSFQKKTGQARRDVNRRVLCLRLFDGTEVIDEDKRVFVVRIYVARSTCVPRAEIAFRIIEGQINHRWTFLLSPASMSAPALVDLWLAYCHGLLVRCGETRIQLPLRGLYLLCEMSSSTLPDILRIRPFFELRHAIRRGRFEDIRKLH